MILPTMNYNELTKEIFSDYTIVERKANYLMDDCRKRAKKLKRKEYEKAFDYKSRQKNDWLIFINYQKQRPIMQMAVYYRDSKGFNAIMVDRSQKDLTHISGHFIERYNERFLMSEKKSKIEILKQFVTRNPITTIIPVPESDEFRSGFFGRFNDEIGLGYTKKLDTNEIIFLSTFIAKEMRHSGQEDYYDFTSQVYEDAWKKEFGHLNNLPFK